MGFQGISPSGSLRTAPPRFPSCTRGVPGKEQNLLRLQAVPINQNWIQKKTHDIHDQSSIFPIFPMKMAIINRDISYILGFSWIFRGYVPFRDKGPHTRVSRAVASPTTVVLPQVVIWCRRGRLACAHGAHGAHEMAIGRSPMSGRITGEIIHKCWIFHWWTVDKRLITAAYHGSSCLCNLESPNRRSNTRLEPLRYGICLQCQTQWVIPGSKCNGSFKLQQPSWTFSSLTTWMLVFRPSDWVLLRRRTERLLALRASQKWSTSKSF